MTELMSEHQRRMWKRMIDLIDDYQRGATGFAQMVGALEGALDAGEFADSSLVGGWYTYWTQLETWRASGDPNVTYAEVSKPVQDMRNYLERQMVI